MDVRSPYRTFTITDLQTAFQDVMILSERPDVGSQALPLFGSETQLSAHWSCGASFVTAKWGAENLRGRYRTNPYELSLMFALKLTISTGQRKTRFGIARSEGYQEISANWAPLNRQPDHNRRKRQ
jgi:hypothetical protein